MSNAPRKIRVADLIQILESMPPDAKVGYAYDGGVCPAEVVFLSRSNMVVLCLKGETIYRTHNRPKEAPTEKENQHWSAS